MSHPALTMATPTALPTSIYGAVWRQIRAKPGHTAVFVVAGTIQALSHGAVAWFAAILGRSLISNSSDLPVFGTISPSRLALFGLAAMLTKGLSGTIAVFSQSSLASATGEGLRDTVIQAILGHGLNTSAPAATARLATRIREVELAINDGALAAIRAAAQLAPIGLALWLLAPWLTVAAAAVLAVFGLALSRARTRLRSRHARAMAAADELHAEVDDLLRHADLWRTYGTGRHIRAVLRRIARRAGQAWSASETLKAALSSANEVLGALALVLALLAASTWDWAGAANLVAFAAVFFMAYRPLRDLGDSRAAIVRGDEALASLSEVTRGAPEADGAEVPQRPEQAPALLEVQDLGIPGRTKGVTFQAQSGSIVAVTGPTGVGKTSLLRAMLGLEQDAAGAVYFGGRLLAAGQIGPAERPFAWVPQDAPVISGTLEDNFALAGVNRTDGEAGLLGIGASDLRDGIANVKLGAGGRPLSGGERRWIALARALATREPVLLLDEPSVGLDRTSKARMLEMLRSLRGRRTLVIVTHDRDVEQIADQVVAFGEA
jgi:ABC-type multidrug transport system fused ATPase/permease subunit